MSQSAQPSALERIHDLGVIPVIRAASEATALKIAEALIGAGLNIIEITMTVPNATAVMASIARRFGDHVVLGAGTVTSPAEADAAAEAGCAFIVTPCLLPDVVRAASARHVPTICGAMTPTEIFEAHRAGADLVKVFPASALGGPAYVRAVRGPFPHIGLVATGGVGLDTMAAYFEAGVVAVGVGGELISRAAVAAGDFREVGEAGRTFLEAARRARLRPAFAPSTAGQTEESR
jgi:2-dehydro-3-deoxyphosphogluconate aldolase/(4S)-4-hydroxy-2-oxoglutarate aldolase